MFFKLSYPWECISSIVNNKETSTIGRNSWCSQIVNSGRKSVTNASTGKLFLCLGQNNFVDFKKILRSDYSENYIKDRIKFALKIKPQKHDFIIEKNIKPYMKRHMNVTGG